MFFHARIFFHSLIFFGILEFVSSDFISPKLDFLFDKNPFFLVLILLLLFLYFYQVSKNISKDSSWTSIPILFVIGSLSLLYFIQSRNQQNLFAVLSATIHYLIHISLYRLHFCKKDQTALGIIGAGNIATIFLMYSVAYGIYLNFAIPLWIFMLSAMLITIPVSFQYFSLINENRKMILNYSVILGFIMAEIVWVLNFWPFGYLTTSVSGLVCYFVFWDIIQSHFLKRLSKKKIVANMIFSGVMIAIVLSSTRWLPAI